MAANHGELLRTVDPIVLGQRVRDARVTAGLTQGEAAGDEITVSYLSRIENGARRPNLGVLKSIARRIGVSTDELLLGTTASEHDEIRLGLDYVELALESGEALDGARQAEDYLARAEKAGLSNLAERARFLFGRTLEVLGKVDQAIEHYEAVLGTATGLLQIECGMALCRTYRDSGDLNLAVEVGERVQKASADAGLERTTEAVKLTVTTASAYAMRGDLTKATHIAADAIRTADTLNSPLARAAAYWNSSAFQYDRGDLAAALPLASRALAILGESTDARNTARLRLQLGEWQMQLNPPRIDEGLANLRTARAALEATSASLAELADADVALSKGLVLSGDAHQALDLALKAQDSTPDRSTLTFVMALIARANALDALGRTEEARQICVDAQDTLRNLDQRDHTAAQLWYELADLLKAVGDTESAWTALHRAAAATGLRPRQVATDQVNRSQDSENPARAEQLTGS